MYAERRKLLQKVLPRKGAIVLFADFEEEKIPFRQDSSFYYFTGLEEPGAVLVIDTVGSYLYVPQYKTSRTQWVHSTLDQVKDLELRPLGTACTGYSLSPACLPQEYAHLLSFLRGKPIYTIYPPGSITESNLIIDRLFDLDLKESIIDVSPLIATLRRTKSQDELELLYDAVHCTMEAQEAAASRIGPGMYEYQIQAALEFVMKESGGRVAFPSIVASGKNSTILHYHQNNCQMKDGDLVVVDIGAEFSYYCADITRTYPVSGRFTDRQRQVYTIVLETQREVAHYAKPGYWLNNKEEQDKSLHHIRPLFRFGCS